MHDTRVPSREAFPLTRCHPVGRRDGIMSPMKTNADANSHPDSATMREAARALYESTPSTLEAVASEFGVSARTLKRWSAASGGWQKLDGPTITARAQLVADRVQAAVADIGPNDSAEQQVAALAEMRTEAAVDERAAVLAKHRGEGQIIRGLVAEAVRGRDGAKARLAVGVARALKLAHDLERKAWGLDLGELPPGTVVVIERG